ncbi:porin [Massilia sp. TSP1-1-2]|uniref:porin n=1 Tax=unclassified Massilia TaxID=2609279 RepID=UPI003CFADF5D
MQVKLLAAVVFASLPLAASAQSSVTVYGVMDAAIAHEDTGAPNGSRNVVNSGNQSSSRLGFKGTEDLGNGLKAMFNIEAGVALDTGASDTALFGRRSVVGLSGGFGSLTLGREYSPIADVAKETDVFGQGFYGSNLNAFTTGRLTRRLSNSVNYRTPTMSGFKAGLAYSAGETSTGPSGTLKGVMADYTNAGLYIGAGYHTLERLASGDDKEMIVGAGYKFGTVELKANYLEADPTGANNQFEQVNLGASYGMDAHKFFANYQTNKLENGAKANGIAVAYTYSLSKRTNVYASYSTLRNNATGLFGMNSSSTNVTPPTTAPGADPKALVLGMRHSF